MRLLLVVVSAGLLAGCATDDLQARINTLESEKRLLKMRLEGMEKRQATADAFAKIHASPPKPKAATPSPRYAGHYDDVEARVSQMESRERLREQEKFTADLYQR